MDARAERGSDHVINTVIATVLLVGYFVIAPGLHASWNGGAPGLFALVCAGVFAWRALYQNRQSPVFRWLGQVPVTVLVTVLTLRDAVAQYVEAFHAGF